MRPRIGVQMDRWFARNFNIATETIKFFLQELLGGVY